MFDPTQAVNQLNSRLFDSGVRLKVEQRGGRLSVRGTFPPKPGSDRLGNSQGRISLGLPVSEGGLKRAEVEVRLIAAELLANQFDWRKYVNPERLPETKPVARWVEEFKNYYMARNSLTEDTWGDDWGRKFKRLPQGKPLSEAAMVKVIHGIKKDTRDRLETCRKFQHLADFAGLKVDLLQFKGSYGPSQVEARDIQTDRQIMEAWERIPNQNWKWVFGVMAAFGLRDHEVFFAQWEADGLRITQGKTGPRLVFAPLFPEWVELWNLREVRLPKIADIQRSYERRVLGDKVCRQFRRYEVGFPPYNLRHAYAIRASVTFGFPVATSAALMGHSIAVHLAKYHKHITLKANQEAALRVMERSDRPKPPVF
jgi:integrase